MADVLIRSFSKILSLLVGPTNVAIDNWTFQMFYKVTPMLLGACVILVCTRKIVVMWSFLRKIPILFNYWQLLKTVLFQSPQEVSSSIWFLRNKRKAFFGNEMNNWYLNDKFTHRIAAVCSCAGASCIHCYHQKAFLFIIKQFPSVTSCAGHLSSCLPRTMCED